MLRLIKKRNVLFSWIWNDVHYVATIKRLSSNHNNDNVSESGDEYNMSDKQYWDKFYKNENNKNFEWLIDYDTNVIDTLNLNNSFTSILDIGCGTSTFSMKLSKLLDKKSYLMCIDFSKDALNHLKKECIDDGGGNNVDFVLCDCNYKLPFRDNLFDLIIDKGFLDSVLKSNKNSIMKSLFSIYNQLQLLDYSLFISSNSKFLLQITDESPELRTDLFDRYHVQYSNKQTFSYSFKEIIINDNSIYYAYFLYKNKRV